MHHDESGHHHQQGQLCLNKILHEDFESLHRVPPDQMLFA